MVKFYTYIYILKFDKFYSHFYKRSEHWNSFYVIEECHIFCQMKPFPFWPKEKEKTLNKAKSIILFFSDHHLSNIQLKDRNAFQAMI